MYSDKVWLPPVNLLLPLMCYDEVMLSQVNSLFTLMYSDKVNSLLPLMY